MQFWITSDLKSSVWSSLNFLTIGNKELKNSWCWSCLSSLIPFCVCTSKYSKNFFSTIDSFCLLCFFLFGPELFKVEHCSVTISDVCKLCSILAFIVLFAISLSFIVSFSILSYAVLFKLIELEVFRGVIVLMRNLNSSWYKYVFLDFFLALSPDFGLSSFKLLINASRTFLHFFSILFPTNVIRKYRLLKYWIFLDSERSDECIGFTMMCVFYLFFIFYEYCKLKFCQILTVITYQYLENAQMI